MNQSRVPIRARPARTPITIPAMAPPESEEESGVWADEEEAFVVESEEEDDDEVDEPDDDELDERLLSVDSQVESQYAALEAAPTVVSESWGIAWMLASW